MLKQPWLPYVTLQPDFRDDRVLQHLEISLFLHELPFELAAILNVTQAPAPSCFFCDVGPQALFVRGS
jgi:hypothetical protein